MKTEILTCEQFKRLIYGGYSLPNKKYSKDLDNIKYFSFDHILRSWSWSEKYTQSLRFCVTYDNNHIYGVLKFAYYESNKEYSIPYCSTNVDFANKGICDGIVGCFVKYFKETYPTEVLSTSEYTLKGWKFLRPCLLKYCNINNVTFQDKIIGHKLEEDDKDEFYALREISKQTVGYQY